MLCGARRLQATEKPRWRRKEKPMKYVCKTCGYVYDEDAGDEEYGIAPGTKFADLPADFECPICGAAKDEFEVDES